MEKVHRAKKIESGCYEYRGHSIFKSKMYVGYIMAPVTGSIPCWEVVDLASKRVSWTTDTLRSAKQEVDDEIAASEMRMKHKSEEAQ